MGIPNIKHLTSYIKFTKLYRANKSYTITIKEANDV